MATTRKSDETLAEAEKAVDARQDQSAPARPLAKPIRRLVILFTGSFNPVTIAHLRLLELARDYYHQRSIQVLEGIISPVSNSYGKAGLAPIQQRVEMIRAAIPETHWLRIDTWEADQPTWTRTKLVLDHHHAEVKTRFGAETELRLLSGADVVRSMLDAKVWDPADIDAIMSEYGVACITRLTAPESGQGGATITDVKEGMPERWKAGVDVIQDWVVNDISATNIRKQLAQGCSVKYIVPDGTLRVIFQYGAYKSAESICLADWPYEKS